MMQSMKPSPLNFYLRILVCGLVVVWGRIQDGRRSFDTHGFDMRSNLGVSLVTVFMALDVE